MMLEPMSAVLVAARLAQFAAVTVLFGAALFRLLAARSFRTCGEIHEVMDAWLQRLLLGAAMISFVSSVAWLLVQSALMSEGWEGAVSGEVLSTVLLQTEFGQLWIGRLALSSAVLILAVVSSMRRGHNAGSALMTGLSALLVVSLAGTGHAVMGIGTARDVDVTGQAVHLVAASVWLGGLLPLGFLLRKVQTETDPAWLAAAQSALSRFSQVGLVAVAALLLTGLTASWSLVGSIGALVDTDYGRVLLAKLAFVLAMIGLAATNRFWLMPRIEADSPSRRNAMLRLSRNVALEQALGLAVLVAVSLLGTLPPGHDSEAAAHAEGKPDLAAPAYARAKILPVVAVDVAQRAPA